MLQKSNQIDVINNIYHSFLNTNVKKWFLTDMTKQLGNILNHKKYSSYTIINFKITVAFIMFSYAPTQIKDLITILNEFGEADGEYNGEFEDSPLALRKFRNKLKSQAYILKEDKNIMESLNISYYDAFCLQKIHAFTVADYYSNHPEEYKALTTNGKSLKNAITLSKIFSFIPND